MSDARARAAAYVCLRTQQAEREARHQDERMSSRDAEDLWLWFMSQSTDRQQEAFQAAVDALRATRPRRGARLADNRQLAMALGDAFR